MPTEDHLSIYCASYALLLTHEYECINHIQNIAGSHVAHFWTAYNPFLCHPVEKEGIREEGGHSDSHCFTNMWQKNSGYFGL